MKCAFPQSKYILLRLLMLLIGMRRCECHTLDIKRAFSNYSIDLKLYEDYPYGFVFAEKEFRVSLLHKDLFVLRTKTYL